MWIYIARVTELNTFKISDKIQDLVKIFKIQDLTKISEIQALVKISNMKSKIFPRYLRFQALGVNHIYQQFLVFELNYFFKSKQSKIAGSMQLII